MLYDNHSWMNQERPRKVRKNGQELSTIFGNHMSLHKAIIFYSHDILLPTVQFLRQSREKESHKREYIVD